MRRFVVLIMTNKFRRFVVNINIFSKDSIVSNHDYVISNVENRPHESYDNIVTNEIQK